MPLLERQWISTTMASVDRALEEIKHWNKAFRAAGASTRPKMPPPLPPPFIEFKCRICKDSKVEVGISVVYDYPSNYLTNNYSVYPLTAPGSREGSSGNVIDASNTTMNADPLRIF